MPLKDLFKRKKKKQSETPEVVEENKKKEKKAEVKPSKLSTKKRVVKEKEGSQAFRVLKEPHISEKSTRLSEKNIYTFKVYSSVNKNQIKKAVENVYGVNVLSVNIINIPSKKRRLGRIEGVKKGYKKAIVQIKKGQKIELL